MRRPPASPTSTARLGIFTRGVLLDVARARGKPWLEAGEPALGRADLDAAEQSRARASGAATP